MVLKLVSKQDWRFLSSELDGQRGRFSQKVKRVDKWVRIVESPYNDCIVTNHLKCNGLLGNKKALFLSMKVYYEMINEDLWKHLPQTYHIKGV